MRKHKQRWIKKAYRWIVKYMGAPKNENQNHNMRQWAAALAADGFYYPHNTPREAVEQDIEYGL